MGIVIMGLCLYTQFESRNSIFEEIPGILMLIPFFVGLFLYVKSPITERDRSKYGIGWLLVASPVVVLPLQVFGLTSMSAGSSAPYMLALLGLAITNRHFQKGTSEPG